MYTLKLLMDKDFYEELRPDQCLVGKDVIEWMPEAFTALDHGSLYVGQTPLDIQIRGANGMARAPRAFRKVNRKVN